MHRQVTVDYEREHEYDPENLSEEHLGFDIRSRHGDEVRQIEVKGQPSSCAMRLSLNEWTQSQQLGETFWLYIAVNSASQPKLYVIDDPMTKLRIEKEVRLTATNEPPCLEGSCRATRRNPWLSE